MTMLEDRSTTNAKLNSKVPDGALADKWDTFKANAKLVNPNNKRKFKVIVVGTGLAGASAAATLAELGYQVDAFTFHDSARRAHSIAAQGGINAAKNYQGDGDSVHRLFTDTIKGGDFRSREGNVYRLAQVSVNIIDQMVAQGVPFAREYIFMPNFADRTRCPTKRCTRSMHVVRPVSSCCSVRISSCRVKLVWAVCGCSTVVSWSMSS